MDHVSRVATSSNLKESLEKVMDPLGGWSKFINTGDVVMLKPNFNTADPFPASTDYDFLKTIVEIIYDHGAKLVMIGESSTVSLNTRKVMEKLKILDLLHGEPTPRIYIFEEGKWVKKEIPEGRYLKSVSLPEIIERADKLILLPCLKTHSQAQFTGSLKLAVGFMKPFQRVRMHLKNLQEKIAELNTLIHPDLVVMDARKCFITEGPSDGEIRNPGLVLASIDRVSIDIEGVKIIQSFKGNSLSSIDPTELPQIKRAVELGIGHL